MRKLTLSLIVVVLPGVLTSIRAQTKVFQAGDITKQEQISKPASTGTAKPLTEAGSRAQRFWFFGSLSTGFDTNINQDPQGTRSFGLVSSMGFHFQNSGETPSFDIEYEAGLHRYTNTEKWNRLSQSLTTSYKRHLFGRWYARTTGELTLQGSSEDRELNNQYLLGQQIEYRPQANIRLIGFAAYRVKRDPVDPEKNSIDPYIGAKVAQKLRCGR